MRKLSRKAQNIAVFNDTIGRKEPDIVKNREEIIANSHLYPDDTVYGGTLIEYGMGPDETRSTLNVWDARSVEAAYRLADEFGDSKKIGILNFANCVTPGGGVLWGASAQEEGLCRVSNLYHALLKCQESYYDANKKKGVYLTGTDAMIYTPDCLCFKSDSRNPRMLPKEKWRKFDFITCAAPMNRTNKFSEVELYMIHRGRAVKILKNFYINGVRGVILGAFGCGAFMNDPIPVAHAWKKAIEEVSNCGFIFRRIIFAIPSEGGTSENYRTFSDILTKVGG